MAPRLRQQTTIANGACSKPQFSSATMSLTSIASKDPNMGIRQNSPTLTSQSGATLVVALILLMVLTILGVSSMNSTGLEEKMSANSQERFRSQEAADAGLSQGYSVLDATTMSTPAEGQSQALSTGSGTTPSGACYTSRYTATLDPPAKEGQTTYDKTFQANYFDIQSIGYNQVDTSGNCTGSANSFGNASTRSATVAVSGGAYQVIRRSIVNAP
jgi:type IV pilus assembly protein PilX